MSEPTSEFQVTPDPDLTVGQRVGEYVIEGKLGAGAFGTVFRGTHPVIGKAVAIKVLARRFSVDPDMVSRFVAEARAVNQIRHRHIIDIFAFGQLEDGRHYYVMELLDGETLDDKLDRDGRMSLAEALPILRAIARALDAAHAKGIAHRDLKAENVFLGASSDPGDGAVDPKLLDFGIAKLLAPEEAALKHKTRTGTPVGTPYYMSPEQCRGRDVDHRTDLYALGVLAYLMLTGEYPLDGDDYMTILIRQMADHPAPPSTIVPELPGVVDDTIAWLMKKDPADRPSHARAAIEALETAAEQLGIAVAPRTAVVDAYSGQVAKLPTNPPRAASGASTPANTSALDALPRRSRLPWVLAGVVVIAAIGVAVYVATRPGEERTTVAAQPAPTEPKPAVQIDAAPKPEPKPEPPPPPSEPKTIIVDVTGVPDSTEVFLGTKSVGVAPGPVMLDRGSEPVVLTFKLDGYLPASKTVTPDKRQPLVVALKKKPAGQVIRKPGKDDVIEDLDFHKKGP